MASEWILQHGWGWDRHCWADWHQHVPHASIKTLDRGYFEAERISSFSPHVNSKVIVTHSYGLHLISKQLFQQADLLAILAGFQSFSSDSVAAMESDFAHDAEKTLKRFHSLCFYPDKYPKSHLQYSFNRLMSLDLRQMQTSAFDLQLIQHIPKVVIIHGDQDCVIPHEKSIELHEQLPKSVLHIISGASHALPMTQSKRCCDLISWEEAR